jgi:hypothetical protein
MADEDRAFSDEARSEAGTAGLDVPENRALQHRTWLVQRVSWVGFAVIIVLALLGYTGSGGPWSQQTIVGVDSRLTAPRVARRGAAERLEITVPGGGPAQIDLDAAFVTTFTLTGVEPAPQAHYAVGRGMTMIIAAQGDDPALVRLHLIPLSSGRASVGVTVNGAELRVALLVLP